MNRTRLRAALLSALAVAPARSVAAGELRLAIEGGAEQVRRYERIEWTIPTNAAPSNPYDPCEIDLAVELTGPAGEKVTVPAFYFQPFERLQRPRGSKPAEWIYPVGPGAWRARFAPTKTGAWSCQAVLTSREGSARSQAVRFRCVDSPGHGFVRVSTVDGRYLAFTDGASFFPVGQNVAFVTDGYRTEAMLTKLAAGGGNFARVWACCEDWALAVEARKSGWGRSWSWNPPIVHAPGREGYHGESRCVGLGGPAGTRITFSPTRPIALRAETRYRLTGQARTDTGAGFLLELSGAGKSKLLKGSKKWTPFRHEFTTSETQWWLGRLSFRSVAACTMYLKDLSLTEADGSSELLAEADVNRPPLGRYNELDCFLLDELLATAEKHGLYLQVVLFTRDHYMRRLRKANSREYDEAIAYAKRLLRYAVGRWGYSTHVAAWEYFNEMNPGLPTERFYRELGEYLERIDANRHLRTNSAWASPSKDYRHPKLDTADIHWYMRPATGDLARDAAAGVLSRLKAARKVAPTKPVLFSEFGMTDDAWKRSADLDRDKAFVHLHNALWASALSGLAGTVSHWFWDDIHAKDMYHHYGPVSAFVADIPYATAKFRKVSAGCDKPLRGVGLQSDDAAYLWISNPKATWWHRSGGAKPDPVRGASLRISNLAPGTYRLEWWDTWTGKVLARAEAKAEPGQALVLAVPAVALDVACKVTRAGR